MGTNFFENTVTKNLYNMWVSASFLYSGIIILYWESNIFTCLSNNIDKILIEDLIPLNSVFIIGNENFKEKIQCINSNDTLSKEDSEII